MEIIEEIKRKLNRREKVAVSVFIDLNKEFDTIINDIVI